MTGDSIGSAPLAAPPNAPPPRAAPDRRLTPDRRRPATVVHRP